MLSVWKEDLETELWHLNNKKHAASAESPAHAANTQKLKEQFH